MLRGSYRKIRFGAIPDDGIDDTAAIQDAIAFAAQHGGNTVFLPTGVYDISAPIMLGLFRRGDLDWQAWPTSFDDKLFESEPPTEPEPGPLGSIVITSPIIDGEIDEVWNFIPDDALVRDSADNFWLDDSVEIYLNANADRETTYGESTLIR